MTTLKLTRKGADQLIADWLNNNVLAIVTRDKHRNLSGLRVQTWL